MSQLSLNQTIQSRVTDSESVQKKGIFKNPEYHSKTRPSSALPWKSGNDDNASIGTAGGDSTTVHKLGVLPTYLKKQTRATVESDLFTKHKKFKIAKRELIEKQTNLMKDFEQLQKLKDKFKQFGGRDFKLETLQLVDFNDYVSSECGDGIRNVRIGSTPERFGDGAQSMHGFQQEVQRIRGRIKDCLFNLIRLNADAFKHIQMYGTEQLQQKIQEIFSKVEDYVKTVNSEQDISMELLLEKLNMLRTPTPHETTNRLQIQDEEIVALREGIQRLEVQSKMLQSEIDVKNQEIEYLKNKEAVHQNPNAENCGDVAEGMSPCNDQQTLHSEIQSQKETIDNYRNKLNDETKLRVMMAEKMKQLEDKIILQKHQMEEKQLKFENDLNEERKKYEGLEKMLDEMRDANSRFLEENGSNYEQISNQLVSANGDIKELQFKIGKRDKQIQSLKQMINSESNKAKDYDQLLLKYDEVRQQDQLRTKEILQLKEKLMARADTINSQMLTITDLKKQLMERNCADGNEECTGPLHDEQMSKFLDHERIIKKLENNKIRSNMLRDQLLDRISMLEKENDDMKGQIRKFHEDFTINRFMYDEQRRKKRLTEILVKQYQK
ncbi:early endosome antigen 1-like [Bradysia coprophila]|uniref:early endosome antigen 1-like n=1 Tax=Bradysia coprophila TaxID=38358 RepID=UPI00187D927D|nr:early endosome antigen 1-like [Bradysia coprophila]